MPGFAIEIDVSAAEAALDRIIGFVKGETHVAVMDAADEVQHTTQELLLTRSHAPHTKTPSPPGTPPAAISGDLAASIRVTELGESDALVGPTMDYGRIQERGGYMQGHPLMHWQEPPGVWHSSLGHDLPDRPYLKPAVDLALPDIEQIFYDAWLKAIQEALG